MARILQFYSNVDLRQGYDALGRIEGVDRDNLKDGEVYLFRNRKMNIIALLSRDGVFKQRLTGSQTWDWKLRQKQMLSFIGRALGLHVTADDKVYAAAQKDEE